MSQSHGKVRCSLRDCRRLLVYGIWTAYTGLPQTEALSCSLELRHQRCLQSVSHSGNGQVNAYIILQTTYLLKYDSVHAANLGVATQILATPR